MNERDFSRPAEDEPDADDDVDAADQVWGPHYRRHHGPGRDMRGRRVRFAEPVGDPEFAGPPFGPWGRGRGRGRARRGDVRAAALALLAEEPMNGYQVMQQIAERSGGLWRVSPGSVYPALSQLEDEGLVELQAGEGGRREYALTEAGRTYVAEHPNQVRGALSALSGAGVTAAVDMRSLVRQVHLAAFQVVSAGTDAQVEQARAVLTQARRALYRILAEDDAGAAAGNGASA